jgi:hypothetical protein
MGIISEKFLLVKINFFVVGVLDLGFGVWGFENFLLKNCSEPGPCQAAVGGASDYGGFGGL